MATPTAGVGHYILRALATSTAPAATTSSAPSTPWPLTLAGISLDVSGLSGASTTVFTGYDTAVAGSEQYSTYPSGGERFLDCFSASTSWLLAGDEWSAIQISEKASFRVETHTSTVTRTQQTILYPANASTYTLCDGTARVDASPITSKWPSTTAAVWSTTIALPEDGFEAAPTCAMDINACSWLLHETDVQKHSLGYYWLSRVCGWSATDGTCVVEGGPVRLLYWPVTTADGDLCLGNGSTVVGTRTGSGPNTLATLGTTLTSPTVYVSFATMFAADAVFISTEGSTSAFTNYHTIGPTFANTVIPFPIGDLSSQCFTPGRLGPSGTALPIQVNLADLNYPVPADAYKCAITQACIVQGSVIPASDTRSAFTITKSYDEPWCSTIYNDFEPILVAPTALTTLVPEWSSCKFAAAGIRNIWWDPPIALQAQSVLAEATAPSVPTATSTPASPASSPNLGALFTALAELNSTAFNGTWRNSTTPTNETRTLGTISETSTVSPTIIQSTSSAMLGAASSASASASAPPRDRTALAASASVMLMFLLGLSVWL